MTFIPKILALDWWAAGRSSLVLGSLTLLACEPKAKRLEASLQTDKLVVIIGKSFGLDPSSNAAARLSDCIVGEVDGQRISSTTAVKFRFQGEKIKPSLQDCVVHVTLPGQSQDVASKPFSIKADGSGLLAATVETEGPALSTASTTTNTDKPALTVRASLTVDPELSPEFAIVQSPSIACRQGTFQFLLNASLDARSKTLIMGPANLYSRDPISCESIKVDFKRNGSSQTVSYILEFLSPIQIPNTGSSSETALASAQLKIKDSGSTPGVATEIDVKVNTAKCADGFSFDLGSRKCIAN